jgi:tetratricopeptide (TPR) repeat protein
MRSVHAALIVALVVAVGCTNRKPVQPVVAAAFAPPRVDVTALVRHGCFDCLERALTAAQGEQAFEVAALLTLRAKELGLSYAGYRERAAALAPPDPAFATYLEAIDAIPVDPLTGERYMQGSPIVASATRADPGGAGPVRLPPLGERASVWREVLATGPGSSLFRTYLDVAISCSVTPRRGEEAADVPPSDTDAPLLLYRTGLCGQGAERLRTLRETDPEFVDADFTLGRYALGARPADLDEALRYMQSAHDAFPSSVAIATTLAGIREEREEWGEALAAFDEVLTRRPEHRDALLGRTISLSRLRRHDEALISATRMIDLGAWFIGEAHYWRAWNQFSLQRYPEARVDADRAKTLMVNAAVYLLSGLIEWNERRLPSAESEFEEALKMDFGRCDAAQYLGRVRAQRNKVPEALAALRQAIQCFDLGVTVRRKLIADIQGGPGSEATKARLTAGHERAIASAIEEREESVQNVAALEKRGTR